MKTLFLCIAICMPGVVMGQTNPKVVKLHTDTLRSMKPEDVTASYRERVERLEQENAQLRQELANQKQTLEFCRKAYGLQRNYLKSLKEITTALELQIKGYQLTKPVKKP